MNYRLLKIVVPILFSGLLAQEQSIDFQQIENLIIERNHELKALEKRIESYKGKVRQNALIPNPELDFESINGDDSETSFTINQTIELGRKRNKRTHIAELELEKAKLSLKNKQSTIINDAQIVFLDLLLAQKIINIKKETVKAAEAFSKSVQKRVAAGRLSPAEEARAQISHATLLIDLNRAQRNIKNNWQSLSSYWGSTVNNYTIAKGDLKYMHLLPSGELFKPDITKSRSILVKDMDIKIQQAIIESEKSTKIPNITFSVGINKVDGADNAYQTGFSMPLKLFDRNQGSIQMSNSKMDQLIEEKIALETELEAKLISIYSDIIIIDKEIEALETTIIPQAEKAYQIINEGYLMGKFNYLDVVDVQRTLYDAEENYWRTIADFNIAVANIELLTGQPFAALSKIN